MDFKDLKEYNEYVARLANMRENEIIWNDSRAHNAIIMKEMFLHSNDIRMFCGLGSVFRDDFAKEIEQYDHSSYKDIIPDLHNAIKSFIDKKGKLTIILEDADKLEHIHNNLSESLSSSNTIAVYTLRGVYNPKYHFSIGDNNKYRREIGAIEHNAFANFNDEQKVATLNKQFNILLESSISTTIEK